MSANQSPRGPVLSGVSPVYGCAGCLESLCERVAATARKAGRSHEIVPVCDAGPNVRSMRCGDVAEPITAAVALWFHARHRPRDVAASQHVCKVTTFQGHSF